MKTQENMTAILANRPPGKDHAVDSSVLSNALNTLAPGAVRKAPDLIGHIKAYIFNPHHISSDSLRRKIRQVARLHKSLGLTQTAIEALLDTLEGMKIIVEEQQLQSLHDLDAFMNAKKKYFKKSLDTMGETGDSPEHSGPVEGSRP
jgi:hypothetical protein